MANKEALGTMVPVGGGDAIQLYSDVITVGRRPGCDIVLNFPDVSKLHCELIFTNGTWQVRDMGSSNGVKVKGVRISGRKSLRPGDEFSVGHHKFTMRYTLPAGISIDGDDTDDLFQESLLEKAGITKPKPTRG
jgi:adenylate cyclase